MAFDAKTTWISLDYVGAEACPHNADKLLCFENECLRPTRKALVCNDCGKSLTVRDAWDGFANHVINLETLAVSCCKTRNCKICKMPFRVTARHPNRKYCSRKCYRVCMRERQGKSYKRIRVNGKRIYLHRYVWEQATGETLTETDVIHHIDENKWNNDISNLEKLSGRAAHLHKHNYHKRGASLIDDDCPF